MSSSVRSKLACATPATLPRRIAVVAFDGISPFHLAVPCLVFGEDRRELGAPLFDLTVCSAEAGALRTAAGFSIKTGRGLGALRSADVVIVPSWRDTEERPPEVLLRALRAAHGRGAKIVGLCLGAFVLGHAGVLDGRTATTHWHWAAQFARQFPAVRLDPAVLYVDQGSVVTSAGTAASLDCCLFLLRQWCGAEVANRVARRLVTSTHRHGGQAQFIEKTLPTSGSETRLQDLLAWLSQHLDQAHSLDELASRMSMSRRTFTRQFSKATGTTVVKWLTHQRLALASRLLETTASSIEQVAVDAGFGSAISLRSHFAAGFGVSPTAYRRQFRAV